MNENTPIMAGTGDNTRTTPDTTEGLRTKLNEISNPVKKQESKVDKVKDN